MVWDEDGPKPILNSSLMDSIVFSSVSDYIISDETKMTIAIQMNTIHINCIWITQVIIKDNIFNRKIGYSVKRNPPASLISAYGNTSLKSDGKTNVFEIK